MGRDSSETTILQELIAIRMQQLEAENGGAEAFREQLQLNRHTYFSIKLGRGNPTLLTLANIADRLGMSFFELLGLSETDARRSLKKHGIDFDELDAAVTAKNRAQSRLAKMRPSKQNT